MAVTSWAAGGLHHLADKKALLSATAGTLLVLVALGATGVLLALLLMLIGFSAGKRAVLGLGFVLLAFFLVEYYYSLDVNLLTKSMILAGSGAALLALRAVLLSSAQQTDGKADIW